MSAIKNGNVLDPIIQDEFQHQSAQIRALFLVEHNEDGTHRASPEVTNFVPTGAVIPYAGASAPSNWLLCDGSQVNRVVYKRLFDIIGTTYGAGDGSTTFNIPDCRQRFPLGKAAAGTGSVLGSAGGNIDHTHSGGSVSGSTANESAHTHGAGSYVTPTHNHTGVTGATQVYVAHMTLIKDSFTDDGTNQKDAVTDESEDPHTHTISTQAAMAISGTSAAGSAHSHGAGTLAVGTSGTANPPFIALNFIIKT